jgi:hypothetical protein
MRSVEVWRGVEYESFDDSLRRLGVNAVLTLRPEGRFYIMPTVSILR